MANESKFIQISAIAGHAGPGNNTAPQRLYALDDEGTVWLLNNSTKKWGKVSEERDE